MSVKILNTSYYDETGLTLSNTSQLRSYNILQDRETSEKFLNIWRAFTITSDVQDSLTYFNLYEITDGDWWDNISAQYYGTPYLWWTIALINTIVNPFEALIPGTQIRILKETYLYQLLKEVGDVRNL